MAVLEPDSILVPALLENFQKSPDGLTALALGASKDSRALEPLRAWLKAGNAGVIGNAAMALSRLGLPESEPDLIEAVDRAKDTWDLARVYQALGVVGTVRALPCLKRQAKWGGAINVYGVAQEAIKKIEARAAAAPKTP